MLELEQLVDQRRRGDDRGEPQRVRAQQRVAGDRAAKLPRAAHEHLRKRRRRRARPRGVAGVRGDHEHHAAERSEREPEHALPDVERPRRDAVHDHEDRADHEAGQAAAAAEGAQERGQPDQREGGDGRRRRAALDGRRERDRQAARERGAGAPSQPLAQDAARHGERGVEPAEAGGHADRRLAGRDPEPRAAHRSRPRRRGRRERRSRAARRGTPPPTPPGPVAPRPLSPPLGGLPTRRLSGGRRRPPRARAPSAADRRTSTPARCGGN